MFAKRGWRYLLAILIIPVSALYGQDKRTFSLPDSVLLFGTYDELRVVTPERVLEIKPPVEVGANSGYFGYPGLAPRGDLVAWGFAVAFQKDRPRYTIRFALGVYSIKEQKWKTYGDFDNIGAPAFSPDGSKIAFVARDPMQGYHLLMFDVATEKMTTMANVNVEGFREKGGIPQKATLGWSPDGKRLVVELERTDKSSLIAVVELDTGEVKPIGEGYSPAWSPAGEWIAYYEMSGEKCMLVHPDGTGTKMVSKVKSSNFTAKSYNHAVVWSPDGKQLLLNEWRSRPYGAIDVVLLDLQTGRSIKKSENGRKVFGWVSRGK
jgi:Tol biopolymer transport system component